ncbi:Phosphonoacetaldehyde hydrolase [Anatilimnocola aggregata]|uniref:phosphonoacetaldehyde hydrolase n=1 Tax=Anatilimnocola aggregata TaxID=2528021 RepID=A0A517YCF4_9BACT|nr:phosphonoacetaldehyde hydrolase [Anatilimnocola aggregata]QDU27914.1 Phosphonoacetaldehyde hydrolase [Anatilimnocola aggregata]
MKSPLQAVILDWAGTTVDYGSRAPTEVFLEIFRRRGVEITVAEARGPMGMAKRAHISTVISLPRVAQLWQSVHGRPPVDSDVQAMYEEFLPLQQETLARGSDLIPGTLEAIAECRRLGLKIGSTTGYTRALMEVVAPLAAQSGYKPDCIICSDDVSAGRPAPWMNFHAAERLNVFPMDAVVVVDDTPVGILAGRNAGCITVGVSQSGNALGLSLAEAESLPPAELQARLQAIEREFTELGAHYVLRSVAELPALLRRLIDGL